ncbi:hypothetical protein Pla52o_36660 [Novipirellula galeiformis]|uniref:Exostosin family protein n=1 Tax=Novipirellula galeiformis TaxID=2528004 RepID=A0A5C6CA66_9BACT|nr:hypothetical protein [Novipirellula galeiformis]TWU21480.1 hypothetical protein Pla52o_36660 [Novipirellula galeiformis]
MQLKNIVRFPFGIRRAKQILASKVATSESLRERPVVLDLYTPQLLFDCARHFASLALHSAEIGSPFYVRGSRLLLASVARKGLGAEMLAEGHATWLYPNEPLPEDAFVLCDVPLENASRVGKGYRQVEMLIGRDILPDRPVMPYPMHPATLRRSNHASRVALRSAFDREAILFAGSQKSRYGRAKMEESFGVLSRLDILNVLHDCSTENASMPIRLQDSAVTPISSAQWLPFLAQHRFFVCCPGAAQPMCHNLIEAMSVGTIPLIEYGDRMRPELSDGENAICFQGSGGLRDAVDRIRRLSPTQLEAMSQRVTQYYDAHLCGKTFLAALRDNALTLSSTQVVMPFHSDNFYAPQRANAA